MKGYERLFGRPASWCSSKATIHLYTVGISRPPQHGNREMERSWLMHLCFGVRENLIIMMLPRPIAGRTIYTSGIFRDLRPIIMPQKNRLRSLKESYIKWCKTDEHIAVALMILIKTRPLRESHLIKHTMRRGTVEPVAQAEGAAVEKAQIWWNGRLHLVHQPGYGSNSRHRVFVVIFSLWNRAMFLGYPSLIHSHTDHYQLGSTSTDHCQ